MHYLLSYFTKVKTVYRYIAKLAAAWIVVEGDSNKNKVREEGLEQCHLTSFTKVCKIRQQGFAVLDHQFQVEYRQIDDILKAGLHLCHRQGALVYEVAIGTLQLLQVVQLKSVKSKAVHMLF